MKVFLSELAESKLLSLNNYLLEKWDMKTRDLFFEKFDKKIEQVSSQPYSCPKSKVFNKFYRCAVSKQNTFLLPHIARIK